MCRITLFYKSIPNSLYGSDGDDCWSGLIYHYTLYFFENLKKEIWDEDEEERKTLCALCIHFQLSYQFTKDLFKQKFLFDKYHWNLI